MNKTMLALLVACALPVTAGAAEPAPVNDATAPLHLMKPNYPTPYGAPSVEGVRTTLGRVMDYLDRVTPARAVDRKTGATVADLAHAGPDTVVAPGDFRLNSYEWGVTYAGMLAAGSALGEPRYTDYAFSRLKFMAGMAPYAQARLKFDSKGEVPLRGLVEPHALDDAGALCAAMVKAKREKGGADLDRLIGIS